MAMPGSTSEIQVVKLTRFEAQVLCLSAQGHSSQEAADRLVVPKRTVDFHLANIYQKLKVNNRVQCVETATRLGLIPFEPTFEHSRFYWCGEAGDAEATGSDWSIERQRGTPLSRRILDIEPCVEASGLVLEKLIMVVFKALVAWLAVKHVWEIITRH